MARLILVCVFILGSIALCQAQLTPPETVTLPEAGNTKIHMICGTQLGTPLCIVDQKIVSQEVLGSLNKENIERIDILKPDTGIERYGEMGKNGMIIVTLKGQPRTGFKRERKHGT